MQKKLTLLLVCFVVFYTLVHSIRDLPDLLHGKLDWNGEKTYTLSVIRIAADMVIAFLFTLLPYLIFSCWYVSKKWLPIILWLAVSLTGCFLLDFCWTSYMEQPIQVRLVTYLPNAVFFFTMYAVFGIAFYFIRYSQYKELKENETLLQTRQSELSFLRSQINPHFLFNNLNNIYALVSYQSDQSLNAIASLSELLQYMLYETSETVALSKEITYIEKYITLQQLKYEHPEKIDFKIAGQMGAQQIPPLLLIPFVENAFKHGDANQPGWLNLELIANEGQLTFSCINKKAQKHKDPEGGIGIDNVLRRLELLYPNRHQLDIKEDQTTFNVKLSLGYGK